MNKIVTTLILIIYGLSSFAQSDTEIDKLIDSLSWKSITMSHSYHTFTLDYQDSAVNGLLKIGKPATNGLLKAIKTPDKTVIIHIILTNIYEPENGNNNLPISYIYKDCDDLIGWHHIYNGLIWEWYSDSNYTVCEPEIDKIYKYWTDRLNDKIKPWQNDVYETFNILHRADSLKYPCNRIYDNNSDKLSINQLTELLNTKYPSNKFETIFKILGNDSVVSKYDDCFYISYGADGIDFRFDKDNYLTTLFFEPAYKSELINNIKLADSKKELLSKLGSPDKQRENWIWYDKYGLGIDFYDDNTIKNLQINRK